MEQVIIPLSLLNAVIQQLNQIERISPVQIQLLNNVLYLYGDTENIKKVKQELKRIMKSLSQSLPPKLELSIKVNDINKQTYPTERLAAIFPTVWSFFLLICNLVSITP